MKTYLQRVISPRPLLTKRRKSLFTVLRPANGSLSRSYTLQTLPRLRFTTPHHTSKLLRRTLTAVPPRRDASTFSSDSKPLDRTLLYDLHIRHGAKMVPFAGYSMPVKYSDLSVGESHKWTREKASLFDVGHMVQHRLSGPGASALLSKITPTSTESLKPNHSTLSCLLHPGTGGIVDDSVITRLTSSPDAFHMVTNAACRDKDIAYISAQIKELGTSVKWDILDHWGLVALQGPLSAGILHDLVWELRFYLPKLHFGQCIELPLRLSPSEWSPPVLVSRGGYTGEDGFEISIPPDATVAVTEALLKSAGPEKLRLAGLGARDSLRLEAGMCLYGHDLDDTTTPVEAGLAWIVSRERRASGGFHGAEVILDQLTPRKEGGTVVSRRRVGLIVQGPPAREGAEIVAEDGTPVGKVTSGCPSPTLGRNIAMGYVKHGMTQAGTKLGVVVRGKQRDAEVVKMPFVQTRYWRGAAGTAPG